MRVRDRSDVGSSPPAWPERPSSSRLRLLITATRLFTAAATLVVLTTLGMVMWGWPWPIDATLAVCAAAGWCLWQDADPVRD